jgi:phage terminase large subunit
MCNVSFLTMAIDINLTKKQSVAWKLLMDDKTNEVCFGGSAGGGKSYIGTLWIATLCIKYPGIRTLIGRTVLQQLKMTTLNTLFEVLQLMGLKSGEHYVYNGQSNIITFYNKSEIILKDLAFNPSDPNYDSLGGIEVTAVYIDEATQVPQLAYNILKSRIRFKLNEFNLIPKLLLTSNPGQTWLKKLFFIPYVQETLEPNKAFVPALPLDNPHLPSSYIEMLKELPPQQRKRLLEGDWNYESDLDSLFEFDSITSSVFRSSPNSTDKKYMTIDVARFGDDRSVVMIWVGLTVISCHIYRKLSTTELSSEIQDLMRSHGIHPSNCIVDSDGVGGGTADILRATNFVNNSKALHNQNFVNLKSQCYIKLSEMFKEGLISINILDPTVVDDLTQELLAVKLKDIDRDNKIGVQSKEEMKKILGKSPDLSDALMMRMLPEIKSTKATGRYALATLG